MTDQLKPCPFCGGKAYISRDTCGDSGGFFAAIRCRQCGGEAREVYCSKGNDCPIFYQQVRDNWNTRADPWQPIETAPKDGTVVFVWHETIIKNLSGIEINIKKAKYVSEIEEWQVEGVGGNMPPVVTHWMPLPEPPKDAGQ